MSTYSLDGRRYCEMLSGGAAVLAQHIKELNALNVFPVADGDTGTNMFCTVEGGLAAAKADEVKSIGEFSRQFSRAALLSARGNSGVILSQIFAGINEYLSSCDEVNAAQLGDAYKNGIRTSYAAVQNPTEGTILTVFRESTEYAVANINENSSVEDFFRLHMEQAKRSLAATPDLLPALAEADVVDSGGAGYVFIAEGMYLTLTGEFDPTAGRPAEQSRAQAISIDGFTRDSALEFGYCTEFLLRLTTAKVNPDSFDISTVLSDLKELSGESVVAYKTDDVIKVHVHTFTPGRILDRMQRYGEFLTVKIENMSLGHTETAEVKRQKRPIKKKFSVVAVSSGEGLSALFTDMGADCIIKGGQTANPSIEEFVEAFKTCNAENIIVLPNNKNILLAAKSAAELYDGARVYVVETKSLMQGYSALSVINSGMTDMDALVADALRAASGVVDCEVTRAVRDVSIEGRAIKQGDYMAITGGRIAATSDSAEGAVIEMLEGADTDLCEIITLVVGREVDAERRVSLTERLEELYPDCEIQVYEGGQEVYDYLLAIE